MDITYPGFNQHALDDAHVFFVGVLPTSLALSAAQFEAIWSMHPAEYHVIKIHGREVKTPRWQQAFGVDYHYTARVNRALALPTQLVPLLAWARETVHAGLNGALVNWYRGELGHYIGPHHDSVKNMVPDAPIVTISFGQERVFRLTHSKTKSRRDFPALNGTVFVMPYETNRVWKHEVSRSARWRGRRISVTFRAFVL